MPSESVYVTGLELSVAARFSSILCVHPMHLSTEQYPLRPVENSYDNQKITAVRHKAHIRKLEIALLREHECLELISTDTKVEDGHCIAVLREGILYITPIECAYQMRPSMARLDAVEERRKVNDKSFDAELPKQVCTHPLVL